MIIEPNLDQWNCQHIALSQALLGVISENIRMVWLDFQREEWVIHFIFKYDNDNDREEAGDAITQFEALQDHATRCRGDVTINSGDLDWPHPPARVIFRRREG